MWARSQHSVRSEQPATTSHKTKPKRASMPKPTRKKQTEYQNGTTMMKLTKINQPIEEIRRNEPNHAIFETLLGPGLIERFDVYRVDVDDPSPYRAGTQILSINIKLGNKLNGHPRIIHGGIISLLFDEAMGWARGVYSHFSAKSREAMMYVTANLNIDYRSPLRENCEVIMRVFFERSDNETAKVKLRGIIESHDGRIFAEATGLFVRVQSKL